MLYSFFKPDQCGLCDRDRRVRSMKKRSLFSHPQDHKGPNMLCATTATSTEITTMCNFYRSYIILYEGVCTINRTRLYIIFVPVQVYGNTIHIHAINHEHT